MAKRLFVGGLPWSINDQALTDLFAKHGKIVSAKVITDKFSGRSKGFGFVEYETDKEADDAIKALNETELEGRKIVVNEARPLEERKPMDRRYDSRGGDSRGGSYQKGGKRW